jgi:succinyl-CoA synthetase beta subunit
MVARLVGTNEEAGRALLADSVLIPAETLADGAQKAVAAAAGKS